MERYSRDKLYLRILNTVSYMLVVFSTLSTGLGYWNEGFLSFLINGNFLMSAVKYAYFLIPFSLLALGFFILSQLDTKDHGTQKRVLENYGFFAILSFIFSFLWQNFMHRQEMVISLICFIFSVFFSLVIFVKGQKLKKYLYDDEVLILINPFSMYYSSQIILLLVHIGIMLSNGNEISNLHQMIISLVMVLFLSMSSVAIYLIYNDVIYPISQILYLAAIAINNYLQGSFMPMGYICFLAILVIFGGFYKKYRDKKKKNI